MLEFVDLLEPVTDLKVTAARIRPLLSKRNIVRIPGFSRNQNDLTGLAQQLGINMKIPGAVVAGPLHVANQSDFQTAPWFRSTLNIHQHMPVQEPALVFEYCVEPTGFIRWFTDQCDVFAHYPRDLIDPFMESMAIYDTPDGLVQARLIREERFSKRPYVAAGESLKEVDGATQDQVNALVEASKNLHGYGIGDIYLDSAQDLLVYMTDGCASGRLSKPEPRQGLWMHLLVKPDFDLIP